MHDQRKLGGLKTSLNRTVGGVSIYPSCAEALPNRILVLSINLPVKVTITHIEVLSHLFVFIFHCTLGSRTSMLTFSIQFKFPFSLFLGFLFTAFDF